MTRQVINGDMKVWDVVQQYPETYGVFRQFGCPDMRKGMFAVSAHFMKLEKLLDGLNEVVATREEEPPSMRH